MGLRFILGGSGSGKSTTIYQEIIERSIREPEKQFIIMVPDQFTMQTQMDLVKMHPSKGIMNIDVLSFSRLSHRIFEEVGGNDAPVLDDTGKSLVIRKVAANLEKGLPILGSNLKKIGYVHQVKSILSEFMQYGVGLEELDEMISFSKTRGALQYKLKDLSKLYEGFLQYMQDKFIAKEESLTILSRVIERSKVIKNSVVVLDGFTGFTPIQNQVIRQLLVLCEQVNVTITIDERENPYQIEGEQNVFHLSKKTIESLCQMAEEEGIEKEKDVVLCAVNGVQQRFMHHVQLAHLEQNLFRHPSLPYWEEEQVEDIAIWESATIEMEISRVCCEIRKLVKEKGYYYRDIAVITGDLPSYCNQIEGQFARFDIPLFLDQTSGIVLNPFIEYMKSGLQVVAQNFSYESVFHYLKSGISEFAVDEIDTLENYVIATGIRGKKAWKEPFTKCARYMKNQENPLESLNLTRERFMEEIAPLVGKKRSVEQLVKDLYAFILQGNVQEKLVKLEQEFMEKGEFVKAKEYSQIYGLVMDLMDQLVGLIGEEVVTVQEFADILNAGFEEMQVGSIPGSVDRVVVGDVERTRLTQVKTLFFLGIHDGVIPKNMGKGGIISDIDREFLAGGERELAPTPRQQMYIQKLYLYLNMTKPSDQLVLSYAKINLDGKSIRPSYLIKTVQNMFPSLEVETLEHLSPVARLETMTDVEMCLANKLRAYVEGEEDEDKIIATLGALLEQTEQGKEWLTVLLDGAFITYGERSIGKKLAKTLYGEMLYASVSRLEKYASCAYAHFLQYGLQLKEREEYQFEDVDMGNIFHGVLEGFGKYLVEEGYTWFDFPTDQSESMVDHVLNAYVAGEGNTILFSSKRNEYAVTRMKRILTRTVNTLQYQLKKGKFVPSQSEIAFTSVKEMKLQGRIDRVDTYETEDKVYVKVVDYKSGNKQLDLLQVFHGLQLQLTVYLNEALSLERELSRGKEVVPAAMLYYHVADPMVEVNMVAESMAEDQVVEELNHKGLVNQDKEVLEALETWQTSKSHVIPVEYKKDGTLSSRSSVASREEIKDMTDYVNQKISALGKEIMDGQIQVNPYEHKNREACTFCDFKKVCGFDRKIKGYEKRTFDDMTKEEIRKEMKKSCGVVKGENATEQAKEGGEE